MTRRIPTVVTSLLLLAMSASCSLIADSTLKSGIGEKCSADDDCQGGVCSAGFCSRDCTSDANCPSPSICIEKLCKLGCTADTACGTGKICEKNACQEGCRLDTECGAGQICLNLSCATGCRDDSGCNTASEICEGNACITGCRNDDACGGAAAGKVCENKKCQSGCRDDSNCASLPGTICEALACISGCRTDAACSLGNVCELSTKTCKPGCTTEHGCPSGEYCDNGACKATLAVSAILAGDATQPTEDGLSASHKSGLDVASSVEPYVQFDATQRYSVVSNKRTTAEVTAAIDDQISKGAKVVITTTRTANDAALVAAPKYPNVKFLAMGARSNGSLGNVGAYYGKTDKQWYATGQLAAREASTGIKCIGMVLPTPTKQIIRETNAFARGVQYFNPDIKIVIRWVGATKDVQPLGQPTNSYKATHYDFDTASEDKLYREELLAAQLADLGCTLVGHRTETQRVINFVEKIANRVNIAKQNPANKNLFSMGADHKDACRTGGVPGGAWVASCLGAPYWNWGPLYTDHFQEMYNALWAGEVTGLDFTVGTSGLMKFELSPNTTATGIGSDVDEAVFGAVANLQPDAVFKGPFSFNGQRDVNADGSPDSNQSVLSAFSVPEDELERICWFVQGIYELPDYQSISLASIIPAMVPYGPPVSGQITTVENTTDSKTKYGDVYSFVGTTLSQNPAQVMSCPLN